MKKHKLKSSILFRHIRGRMLTMVKELGEIEAGIDGKGDIHLPLPWLVKRKNTLLGLISKIDKKL